MGIHSGTNEVITPCRPVDVTQVKRHPLIGAGVVLTTSRPPHTEVVHAQRPSPHALLAARPQQDLVAQRLEADDKDAANTAAQNLESAELITAAPVA